MNGSGVIPPRPEAGTTYIQLQSILQRALSARPSPRTAQPIAGADSPGAATPALLKITRGVSANARGERGVSGRHSPERRESAESTAEHTMTKRIEQAEGAYELSGSLKGWVMIVLTLIFVTLYALALTGWLKPLADEKMIVRLEPIIFVIIGYYFGRLPAQQNEGTLKGEIERQTKRADALQQTKEHAQLLAEALEEKVKNARAALASAAPSASLKALSGGADKAGGAGREDALRGAAAATLSILNS